MPEKAKRPFLAKKEIKASDKSIEIDNYLSDVAPEILSFLEEKRRVLLKASPGTGKTTLVAKFCISHIQQNRPGRIIFCSPFLIIQGQFKTAIEDQGYGIDLALNHKEPRNFLKSSDYLITSTFKSLRKIESEITSDDYIIVDEAHALLFNYKKGGRREFYFDMIRILFHTPAKILAMSATPYSGISNLLGLSEIRVKKENLEAKINVQYTKDKNTSVAHFFAADCLEEFGKDSLNIIYIKNKKECERIKYILEDNFDCKALVITASTKESEEYEELKLFSTIPEDIDFLITTNVISTGTNILNKKVGKALMLNEYNPIEIKQFSKRFRKKLDIEVDVVNKLYQKFELSPSRERNLLLEKRSHQRLFYYYSLGDLCRNYKTSQDDLEINRKFYSDEEDVGSPRHLIDSIIKRLVILEAYFEEEIAKTYNTPQELVDALNIHDDILSLSVQHYNFEYQDSDLGEEEFDKLKQEEFQQIILGFIKHPKENFKAVLNFYEDKGLNIELRKLKQYLRSENILSEIPKIEIPSNYLSKGKERLYHEIVSSLLHVDEFFKDRNKSLYFISKEPKNKWSANLIALYVNDLFHKYFEIIFHKDDERPRLRLSNSVNREILEEDKVTSLTLDLIESTFSYLTHKEFFNPDDLENFLLQQVKVKKLKSDNIVVQNFKKNKETKEINGFSSSLLRGLAKGIFIIDPILKARPSDRKDPKKRKKAYIFLKDLPWNERSTSPFEQKERELIESTTQTLIYNSLTIEYKDLNLKNSTRLISSKEYLTHSLMDKNYFSIF